MLQLNWQGFYVFEVLTSNEKRTLWHSKVHVPRVGGPRVLRSGSNNSVEACSEFSVVREWYENIVSR
jgi:hypothetical protein